MIGRQVSHYHIIRVLGSGAMGVVYEARDTRLPRSVALKLLKPGRLEDPGAALRFKREAQLASSLNHRNICTILDVDEGDGLPFIAMELLDGMSLKSRLAAGILLLEEVLPIATQIVDALVVAHAHGIMHRDISPGNIFLCRSGQAKLLDFGLAKKVIGDGEGSDGLSTALGGGGSIHYAAPEQLSEKGTVDYRCDFFALGSVLYQMATGVRPFDAPSIDALVTMIQYEAHVPMRQLRSHYSTELEPIVDRLLAKQPADRYQSAAEIREDLRRLQPPASSDHQRQRKYTRDVSVAVLPFKVIGQRRAGFSAFRHGLVEDISVRLSALDGVSVAAPRSARTFDGKTVFELGRQLGVDVVVDGSIQASAADLRVVAHLVDAEHGTVIGKSIAIDTVADFTLRTQRAAAIDIASRLASRLRVETPLEAGESEAFHAFKRGQHQWLTSCYSGGWRVALGHFQHSLALDPTFTRAHVAIARAYNFLGYYCIIRPSLAFSVARQSAERALSLDGDSGAAYAELASACFGGDWDWDRAESLFRQSLELSPRDANAHVYYSWLLTLVGRTSVGLSVASAAVALQPESPNIQIGYAHSLYIARQFDQAIAICATVLAAVPIYVFALHVRGLCFLCKGMGAEAIADFETVATLTHRTPFYLALLALCYREFGTREKGLALLEELDGIAKEAYVHPQCYAFVYAGLGRNEKIEFQERAYEHGASPLNYLTPFFRELFNLDLNRPTHREQMRLIV